MQETFQCYLTSFHKQQDEILVKIIFLLEYRCVLLGGLIGNLQYELSWCLFTCFARCDKNCLTTVLASCCSVFALGFFSYGRVTSL